MSQFLPPEHHGSTPGCPVCGSDPCRDKPQRPIPFDVAMEQELQDRTRPQRMYEVKQAVTADDGSLLHHAGKLIPLDEAVRLGLPGAALSAAGGHKPLRPVHDRARHPAGDR